MKKTLLKRHYREAEVIALFDEGLTMDRISAETRVGKRQVRHIIERERLRREGSAINPEGLALSKQDQLNTAIRQHKHKLDVEFEQRVRAECIKRIDEVYLPSHRKRLLEAEEILKTHRQYGVFTSEQFKKIIACLHPDRVDASLKERFTEAFNLMNSKRLKLVSEAEEPTVRLAPLPRTYADLMARKDAVSQARRAKRANIARR